jgi:hypothetical protein
MTLSEQSVCAECEEPIDGDRYRYDPVGWLCAGCFAGLSEEEQEWRLATADQGSDDDA